MGAKLSAHLDLPIHDLPERLDNHLLRLDVTHPERLSADGTVWYDVWGVGFSTVEEGYHVADHPLGASKDLDEHAWPDPTDPFLWETARERVAMDAGEHFLACNLGFCLLERAWALRGFQTFLMDLVLDPSFAEELLERITAVQLGFVRQFLELGLDAGYFGDDYGAQKGMLFSPDVWRQMFKPRLARLFAPFREIGLPVILHSDGDVRDILPDLVEIGVTVLNPVQPEVLDHQWLRSTFGQVLAYYGGISTQSVLPYGSPDDVRAAAEGCTRILAPHRTGLVAGTSHRLMSDVPVTSVHALLYALNVPGGLDA
jgi:uroporphyrinogen decarboxylase